MKRTSVGYGMQAVLLCLSLCVAGAGYGQVTTNAFPYAESFESFVDEQLVLDDLGWAGEEDAVVARAYTYAKTPKAGYPLTNVTHDIVLEVQSSVTNFVDGPSQAFEPPGTLTWIDLLVKPRFVDEDEDPPSDLPEDAQMAFYFDHLGQLNIFHAEVEQPGSGPTPPTYSETNAVWSVITDIQHVIEAEEWVRISIAADYTFSDFTANYFEIYLDGSAVTHSNAVVAPGTDYDGGGTWFPLATVSQEVKLNALSFRGTGFYDDIVISDSAPVFESFVYHTIAASAVGGGSISPEGNVYVLEGEDSPEFTFSPFTGYALDDVVVVEDGATNSLGAVSAYTFTNVMENGSITAYFVADGSENDPPQSWFDDTGVDEGDVDNDLRGDGMTPRQAWLASTHPTDTNFSFRVVDVWRANGTNYIEWLSVYVDTNLPPFGIYARTNLMNGAYDLIGTYPRVAGAQPEDVVTNIWYQAAPTHPVYYRVYATNAVPEF